MKEVVVKLKESVYELVNETSIIRGKDISSMIDELLQEYFFRENRTREKEISTIFDISKEIWKDIPEYENIYQASNMGRVASLRYGFKIRSLTRNTSGYVQCNLRVNNIQKIKLVHRIVAETFLNKCDNCNEVDHINGIKSDNRLENLQWTTRSNNIKSNYSRGISSQEKHIIQGKKVEIFDLNGNSLGIFPTIISATKYFGICEGNLSECCNPKKPVRTVFSKTMKIRIIAKLI